jgi:membrane-associated protein
MEVWDWIVAAFQWCFDLIIHFDQHVQDWVDAVGVWIYAVSFLIIFLETGVIIFPFLPGDSLLFALGAVAAANPESILKTELLIPVLIIGAILGGILNYYIGLYVGPHIFQSQTSRWFNRNHLLKTQAFYEKHGGKTVVLARFIPIFRTFVPFVAGIGRMQTSRFHLFNVGGALFWVIFMTTLGHYFGNIPVVREHFGAIIPMIIIISALPVLIEIYNRKFRKPNPL